MDVRMLPTTIQLTPENTSDACILLCMAWQLACSCRLEGVALIRMYKDLSN